MSGGDRPSRRLPRLPGGGRRLPAAWRECTRVPILGLRHGPITAETRPIDTRVNPRQESRTTDRIGSMKTEPDGGRGVARVSGAEAFLVDLAVEQVRTDAVQTFLSQETVFVELTTDDGNTGLGYTYTIGTGGTAVLALLRDHLLPRLIGADATRIEAVWHDLFASTRATTVGAITSLALAAVDPALGALRCRRAGEPLWRVAGGFQQTVPLYDTETGWLHLTTDELVAGALKAQHAGWRGIKVKVGKPSGAED